MLVGMLTGDITDRLNASPMTSLAMASSMELAEKFWLGNSPNQILVSPPELGGAVAKKVGDEGSVGVGKVVTTPLVVMLPTELPANSVNQILPSSPFSMP